MLQASVAIATSDQALLAFGFLPNQTGTFGRAGFFLGDHVIEYDIGHVCQVKVVGFGGFVGVTAVDVGERDFFYYLPRIGQGLESVTFNKAVVKSQALPRHQAAVVV